MSRQFLEYHAVIGHRFIPGINARVQHEGGGYFLKANGDGFRSDREFDRKKRANTRRILLFGDSFTAGDGVSNGERYSDFLEAIIPNCEVYNFGLPGTGTDQQYLTYMEYAKAIEHDLLIIAFQVENIRRNTIEYFPFYDDTGRELLYQKPYFEVAPTGLLLRNVPPRKAPLRREDLSPQEGISIHASPRYALVRGMIRGFGVKDVAQRLIKHQPFPEYADAQGKEWSVTRALLREWTRNHPKPSLIFLIPWYAYVEEISDATDCLARFREFERETSVLVHNPLPDLWKYSRHERRGFRFDSDPHPTPAAHAAYAASLGPVVAQALGTQD